jgi:hypothetical protein
MSESMIEAKIRLYIKNRLGGKAYKFVSPGNNGVPDRLIVLPFKKMIFLEVKDTGKKPGPLQLVVHEQLRALGQIVIVTDDFDDFEKQISNVIQFL